MKFYFKTKKKKKKQTSENEEQKLTRPNFDIEKDFKKFIENRLTAKFILIEKQKQIQKIIVKNIKRRKVNCFNKKRFSVKL